MSAILQKLLEIVGHMGGTRILHTHTHIQAYLASNIIYGRRTVELTENAL